MFLSHKSSNRITQNTFKNCMELTYSCEIMAFQVVIKLLAFYTIPKFITVFTTAHHCSLFYVRITKSENVTAYVIKINLNSILTFTPRSSKWYLPFYFPTNILYVFLISPICATLIAPSFTLN